MRTRQQLMAQFQQRHRNPVNVRIHMVATPAIVISTLALAWLVPIGRWSGVSPSLAPYVNLATAMAVPIGLLYLRLSVGSLLAMAAWFGVSIAGILGIQAQNGSVFTIAAVTWVVAWIAQIYGHRVEGKHPSASDDPIFFLIGPLFVTDRLLGRPR